MKKVLSLIIIIFFSQSVTLGEEALIWDYNKDKFLNDLLKGKSNIYSVVEQKKLDDELSKNLEVELIYTNLKDCLTIALDNNYSIKSSSNINKAERWEVKNSKAQFLPDATYFYNIQNLSGTYLVGGIVTDNVNEVPIESTIQLDLTGNYVQKAFYYAQRKNILKASGSNLKFTRDQVIRDTALNYYDLLGLKLNLGVLKTNLLDRHEQYKLTKARYKSGLGSKFDVVRAEAEEAKAKQEYISAFNNIRLKQARLANIMGIEILNAIYPTETSIDTRELVDKSYDIEKLYNNALATRYDINAKKWDIEALKAQRSSNYADYAPELILLYQNSMMGTKRLGLYPSNTLGLFTTISLGDKLGVGTYTKIKAYNARIESEKNKLIELTRSIKESILGSYYNSRTALERIEAAKKEVEASDESLKISLVRLAVGQSTFLDVIAAQNIKVTARQRLISTIIEYNRAQVQLLFDSGTISVNSVLYNYQIPKLTP